MLIRIRRTRTHPAADWTSANPWLEPLEMGVEEESPHKAKINFSDVRVRWNSLEYWNPAGSSPLMMVTATVQTNVGTKQALLAAVPTGKKRIVTQVIARNASASLADLDSEGDWGLGFDAGCTDWRSDPDYSLLSGLTDSSQLRLIVPTQGGGSYLIQTGTAGEVFGTTFGGNVTVTATLDIDVHYYDVDA